MAERKISAQDLAADIGAGMDHRGLMDKYQLSSETLEKFYAQLRDAGKIAQYQVDSLNPASETGLNPVWTCPACGVSQPEPFSECPVCGIVVAKFKKDQHKTDEPFDESERWHRGSSDLDDDDEADDEADTESDETAVSESEGQSGGVVSHALDWISDTASSISDSVSDWTSSSSESAGGEAGDDPGSDSGDSGSDGGGNGGGNGGGGNGGGD